jgi:hypothetical protein
MPDGFSGVPGHITLFNAQASPHSRLANFSMKRLAVHRLRMLVAG